VVVDIALLFERRSGQLDRNLHSSAHLEGLLHKLANSIHIKRLQQIIIGSPLHSLDRRVARASGRDEDHGKPRVMSFDFLERLDPRNIRKHDIEHHEIGGALHNNFQAFAGGAGGLYRHPRIAKCLAHEVQRGTIVVDHKDGRHGRRSFNQ